MAFLPQGPQLPHRKLIIVVLEPGMLLHLRLGEEVLLLDPQGALRLSLVSVLLLVVPEQVLMSLKDLLYPAHARWLLFTSTETVWEIDIENGSVRAQRAENVCVAPSVKESEAPQGFLPVMGPPSNLVHGIGPSSRRVLYLKPCYRAAVPQGSSQMPKPRPWRQALPEEFNLDLHGLEPLPNSALRPLPPSPSPEPTICHEVLWRPMCKARRRLFSG
ncbi:proline-rich protein 23D1-like isoform X1 [Symphalangus syndactylus]|uniref:proline-rich protein 23D1-like n=1 Tax=Symphalangus syndactylus TaxID=9590 RepID=UPI0030055242